MTQPMLPVHASPFVATSAVLPDRDGVEQLIVILKATFDIAPGGGLTPAPEQEDVIPCDRLRGEPASSSIEREAELVPPKPAGTDVFLLGHALAPRGGARETEVRLRVGPVRKRALVVGNRMWHDAGTGAAATAPQPFERVPLVYECAFGGQDQTDPDPAKWEGEPRNPVGRGFRARSSRAEWRESLLPNLEDPDHPIRKLDDRPAPVGFGPIGRHWAPRVSYVGTYDEAWREQRMPLLPADFDQRFHHAAPPDQIVPGHVRGGEAVEIVGCTPQLALELALPTLRPRARVKLYARDEELELRCDTVTVDADRLKLLLLYRAALALPNEVLDVSEIVLDVEGGGA